MIEDIMIVNVKLLNVHIVIKFMNMTNMFQKMN